MRVEKIDFLRFIGILMIVLAHTSPPAPIDFARNFDVPLMVLLSGASFAISNKGEAYLSYLWKRIKRLVFPVWIFLTLYFLACKFAGFPAPLPTRQMILSSYMLQTGIGFVWIIRIFLLVAIISPVLLQLNAKLKSASTFYAALGLAYLLYEAAFFILRSHLESGSGKFFTNNFLGVIPYFVVFSLGTKFPTLIKKQTLWHALAFSILFLGAAACLKFKLGYFPETQAYKYPARIYYLSYALLVSSLLWIYGDGMLSAIKKAHLDGPMFFVARNTIWIYLWHIPFLDVYHLKWFYRYPCVLLSAVAITWIQVTVLKKFILPKIGNVEWKKSLNMVLTG